ncbi:MAG: hypothetical protein H0W88_09040 [Parachlamydiaceae bacterium]|nr:hypothetical protein [Parachlamydiaceae bacterium]
MSLDDDPRKNVFIPPIDKELQKKVEDLEDVFIKLTKYEKHQKLDEIGHFILDNRNCLDLKHLEKKWDHNVKQLVSQTTGFWSFFQSSSTKEELLERAQYAKHLKDVAIRAKKQVNKDCILSANKDFEKIVGSFNFITESGDLPVENGKDEEASLSSEDTKKCLELLVTWFNEKDHSRYIDLIHFIINHKDKLKKELLVIFAGQLDRLIQKNEYIIKHKDKLLLLYPQMFEQNPQFADFFTSLKLNTKIVYLKDIRDLIRA